MNHSPHLHGKNVTENVIKSAPCKFGRFSIVCNDGLLYLVQILFVVYLGVKIAGYDAVFLVCPCNLDVLAYAKACIPDIHRLVVTRLDDHVRRHVFPLINRLPQARLGSLAQPRRCLKLQIVVDVHFVPGNLVYPDKRPSGFVVVQPCPLSDLLFMYRQCSYFSLLFGQLAQYIPVVLWNIQHFPFLQVVCSLEIIQPEHEPA